MTLYFVGGEDTSFNFTGTNVGVDTLITHFRPAFAREALQLGGNGSLSNNIITPKFTSISAFWVHAETYFQSNVTTNNAMLMGLYDSSGTARLLILGTGNAGQLEIAKITAGLVITSLVVSPTNTFTNGLHQIDWFVDYSTTGRTTLYIDGTLICDTGSNVDITTNGATSLAQLFLGNTSITGEWSEIIVQDTTTIGMGLWTLVPANAGTTQTWTPNNVSNIDGAAIRDTNLISTDTDNATTQWTTNYTAPPGGWNVVALVGEARVSVGTTGPQHFSWLTQTTDGSVHTQGTIAATTIFQSYGFLNGSAWGTNPHTGAAWQIADFNIGFNIGIEALA